MVVVTLLLTPAGGAIAGEVVEINLDNGLKLLLKENPVVDIIALQVFIRAGLRYEEKYGMTEFVQKVILKGTEKRRAEEIALEIDSLGAHLGVSTLPDAGIITLQAPVATFPQALELLLDILTSPTFPPQEVEKERQLLLDAIKRRKDDPFSNLYDFFRKTYYQEHPYSQPELGTEKSIRSITRDELVHFYRSFYRPNNMVVAVVGKFDVEEMATYLREVFAHLPPGERIKVKTEEARAPQKPRYQRQSRELGAAWIIVGYPAPSLQSPDYVPLKVLNSILGTGMSSRLFINLREKRALAYSVGTFYPSRCDLSHFVAYAIVPPDKIGEAIDALKDEVEKIRREGVTQDELKRAIRYLTGSFIIAHETNASQAWYLAWFEILGRGYRYDKTYLEEVRRVKTSDVQRVAQLHLSPPCVVVIAPEK